MAKRSVSADINRPVSVTVTGGGVAATGGGGGGTLPGTITPTTGNTVTGNHHTHKMLPTHAALPDIGPDDHHAPVTVGNTGLFLSGQDVSLRLATVSGLEISSGLRLADSIAGDGLTIASKVLAVGVSGLGLSVGADAVTLTSSSNPGAAASILASDASGHLQLTRLGLNHAPDYPLHVAGATQQVRVDYNDSNYLSVTVGSDGAATLATTGAGANLNLNPGGDVVFDPTGNDLLPATGYDLNLGSLQKKYLTLHAAELWVETLVAQDTIATIGGRILVGPTTTLTRDFGSGDRHIYVKHNEMAVNDVVYLEANGKVEFIRIIGNNGVQPEGDYQYDTLGARNLDGSGLNDWYAGDAVFNTGQAGDGFIDLYSVRGVKSGSGPTIVGNVRNSATFNDWSEHWAIGNLDGIYGYGTTAYGAAFGRYANNSSFLTADATNGIRILKRASGTNTVLGQWAMDGAITIGEVAAGQGNVQISAGAIALRVNTTETIKLYATGAAVFGQVATGKGNAFWNPSNNRMEFRGSTNGTVVQAYVDTDGSIVAGGGKVRLDADGIGIESYLGDGWERSSSYVFYDAASAFGGMASYNSMLNEARAVEVFVDARDAAVDYRTATLTLRADAPLSKSAAVGLLANGSNGGSRSQILAYGSGTITGGVIELSSYNVWVTLGDTAGATSFWIRDGGASPVFSVDSDGNTRIDGGLNVGFGTTGAGAGSISASGGLNVGTATGAGTGDVFAQGMFRVIRKTPSIPSSDKGLEIFFNANNDHAYIESMNRDTSIHCPINYRASLHMLRDGRVLIGTTSDDGVNLLQVNGAARMGSWMAADRAMVREIAAPAAIAGWLQIFGDSVDGDLKVRFPNGTIKTIQTN